MSSRRVSTRITNQPESNPSTPIAHNESNAEPLQNVRRSGRKRTPNKRNEYLKSMFEKHLHGRRSMQLTAKENTPNNTSPTDEDGKYEDDDDDDDDDDDGSMQTDQAMECRQYLFDTEKDVAGKQVYGFHTPKKRDAMARLAENTPRTPTIDMHALTLQSPQTPKGRPTKFAEQHLKTPVSGLKSMSLNSPRTPKGQPFRLSAKTPQTVREKIKRAASRKHNEDDDEDCEESCTDDEDSDYVASGDESSESKDESSEDSESNASSQSSAEVIASTKGRKINVERRQLNQPKQIAAEPTNRRSMRVRKQKEVTDEFIPDSDNYFRSVSSKMNKTSNNTMDRLKSSQLQYDDLFKILNSVELSAEHHQRIGEMNRDYEQHFDKWMLEMSKGYNIIIYGIGSKQMLLHRFCEVHMAKRPVLIVNGFFPSLTVKDILNMIKTQVLNITQNARNEHESVDIITQMLARSDDTHLFLVINNIDGVMLRKTKDQHILSRLAKIPNIHLIASIDHINASLMWDQTCMDNYNFIWYDCTTMLPYKNETAFENSVFLQNSGELELAAMNNVFRSCTKNACDIYMVLVKDQLNHQSDASYPGITFKKLYQKCRDNFFVSADSALRTQLTEFVDHNMAKLKRSNDGTEHVSIPTSISILRSFSQQQQAE